MIRPHDVIRSIAFYPVTAVYGGAVAVLVLLANGSVRLDFAILSLFVLAMLVVLISALREIRTVHLLVNSQRAEMAQRIEQLSTALRQAGVEVPGGRNAKRR